MGAVWSRIGAGDYPDTDEWVRGKVCIVTGSNSGLGYYTALYLARMGAHVILACRNIEKAEKARREIIDASGNDLVEVMQVDLTSLDSVRNFAREFERRDLPLHVLVNNASVFMTPYANTVDGFERQFQTNYLGPFLLTNLLLPRMIETGNARIVNVSSQAHRIGKLEWDNLQMDKGYSPLFSYGRTKLMIAMASYELARRLAQQGAPVTVNVVDPFLADTGVAAYSTPVRAFLFKLLQKIFGVKPEEAAQTFGWVASSPALEGMTGKYFIHNKRQIASSSASYNLDDAKRLWDVSARLVGLGATRS
jgi:NAD(P)-dependent dehydrogenase (short-subunit alcohol dehydrogenase family)